MVLVQKTIKNIYLGQVDPTWEFYYDFRGWSLAGFQAAGWNTITTNWSYTIDSNWLWINNWSNDRYVCATVTLPEMTNAKYAEITIEAYFIAGSWSNNKWCWFWDWTWERWHSTYDAKWHLSYNTASPWTYNRCWTEINADWWSVYLYTISWVAMAWWDVKFTQTFNLETWETTYNVTWANTYSWTGTMTAEQISAFKSRVLYWYSSHARWYSNYNWERIKTLYIKIT